MRRAAFLAAACLITGAAHAQAPATSARLGGLAPTMSFAEARLARPDLTFTEAAAPNGRTLSAAAALTIDGRSFGLAVEEGSYGRRAVVAVHEEPAADFAACDGRGLRLIDALAADWGVFAPDAAADFVLDCLNDRNGDFCRREKRMLTTPGGSQARTLSRTDGRRLVTPRGPGDRRVAAHALAARAEITPELTGVALARFEAGQCRLVARLDQEAPPPPPPTPIPPERLRFLSTPSIGARHALLTLSGAQLPPGGVEIPLACVVRRDDQPPRCSAPNAPPASFALANAAIEIGMHFRVDLTALDPTQEVFSFETSLRLAPEDIRPTDFTVPEATPAVARRLRAGAFGERASPLGRRLNDAVARLAAGREQTLAASIACQVQADASLACALPPQPTALDRIAVFRTAQGEAEPIDGAIPVGALTRIEMRIEVRFE